MPLDHFDLIAPIYARARYHAAERMREIAVLPIQGRLLDLGGGTGRVALALRPAVDEIVVTDISMGMLRKAPYTTSSTRLPRHVKCCRSYNRAACL